MIEGCAGIVFMLEILFICFLLPSRDAPPHINQDSHAEKIILIVFLMQPGSKTRLGCCADTCKIGDILWPAHPASKQPEMKGLFRAHAPNTENPCENPRPNTRNNLPASGYPLKITDFVGFEWAFP